MNTDEVMRFDSDDPNDVVLWLYDGDEEAARAATNRELAPLLHQAGEADVALKVAMAKALLRSRAKTVSEREAEATIEVQDLLLQKRVSEAVADACRETIRATRDQLTACCSIGANLRAEMQMSGYSQNYSRGVA